MITKIIILQKYLIANFVNLYEYDINYSFTGTNFALENSTLLRIIPVSSSIQGIIPVLGPLICLSKMIIQQNYLIDKLVALFYEV